MKVSEKYTKLTVDNVTASWGSGGIKANPEYQRGLAWSHHQQAMLADSLFRGYPLPRFYFHEKKARDPLGNESVVLEVIDGQQRIIALTNFRQDKWLLLDPKDPKAHLPKAIRNLPCPWANKTFSALPNALQQQFLSVELPVVIIESFDTPEEVRDLFIRLQAGTALTRQQVRDAWPGNIGPFVESLAGKMSKRPQFSLFGAVDKRGTGSAENSDVEDPYHDSRQTSAQLLCIFLRRLQPGGEIPNVSAASLDEMYYEFTDFDTSGDQAERFRELLAYCDTVVDQRPKTTGNKKMKVTKRDLFALALTIQDLMCGNKVSIPQALPEIEKAMWEVESFEELPSSAGRIVSASAIAHYYEWFIRNKIARVKLVGLDPKRAFDSSQQQEIWEAAGGECGVCQRKIDKLSQSIEYDHILPWILGGRTVPENGRPVHSECHQRGRMVLQGLTGSATQ